MSSLIYNRDYQGMDTLTFLLFKLLISILLYNLENANKDFQGLIYKYVKVTSIPTILLDSDIDTLVSLSNISKISNQVSRKRLVFQPKRDIKTATTNTDIHNVFNKLKIKFLNSNSYECRRIVALNYGIVDSNSNTAELESISVIVELYLDDLDNELESVQSCMKGITGDCYGLSDDTKAHVDTRYALKANAKAILKIPVKNGVSGIYMFYIIFFINLIIITTTSNNWIHESRNK